MQIAGAPVTQAMSILNTTYDTASYRRIKKHFLRSGTFARRLVPVRYAARDQIQYI